MSKPIVVKEGEVVKFQDQSFLDSDKFLVCPNPFSTELEGKELLNSLLNQQEG